VTTLRIAPPISSQSHLLAHLPPSVGVARPGDPQCTDRLGALRCVRRPHPQHPHAHVRVAGHHDGGGLVQPIRRQVHETPQRLAG
jgi:hypothetical protein